jgi:NAD-dependent dihydropyrimidine dehydrogenase PreA subunit
MIILEQKCRGCGVCADICPVQAISIVNRIAVINKDRCVECGLCLRTSICPQNAIAAEKLEWPRSVRSVMSDPLSEFAQTGVTGRGTEEMKTNDVTERFKLGEVGFALDVGRPNTGTTFKEIEKIAQALIKIGIKFERDNPITFYMEDPDKGTFKPELREQFIMSGILEFKVPQEMMIRVLETIMEVEKRIDTVFTLGIITRLDDNGDIPIMNELEQNGFQARPNGKTNIGLGRI